VKSMKKQYLLGLVIILALPAMLFLSSCGNGSVSDEAPAAAADNTVNFWGWGNNQAYDQYYNNFARDFPQWRLVRNVGQVPFSEIMSAYLSGNMPDVLYIDAKYFKQMMFSQMLRPMDEYFLEDRQFDINKLNSTVVTNGSRDGQFYFWGDLNGAALFYNKRHFSAAGLDPESPPKTWTEFIEYAKACSRRDSNGVLNQLGLWDMEGFEQEFAAAYGQNWFDSTGTVVTIDNQKNRDVFNFSLNFLDEIYGGRDNRPANVTFGAEFGNVSMIVSDINTSIFATSGFAGTTWGMGYLPRPDHHAAEQKLVGRTYFGYCLPHRSNNPAGGWDWIRWYFTNGLVVGEKIKHDQTPTRFSPFINTYEPTKAIVDELFTSSLTDANIKAMLDLRDEMLQNVFMIEHPITSVVFDELYSAARAEIWGRTKTVNDALMELQRYTEIRISDWLNENTVD